MLEEDSSEDEVVFKKPPPKPKQPSPKAPPKKQIQPPAPSPVIKSPAIDLPKFVVLLHNLQESFQLAWVPQSLACRETEKESIYKLWTQAITAHEPCAMYISGSPGTGKSASVREIWQRIVQFEKKEKFSASKIIYLNCMELSNPKKIFQDLYLKLNLREEEEDSTSAKEMENALKKYICSKRKGMM
jgi:hypothetical protein